MPNSQPQASPPAQPAKALHPVTVEKQDLREHGKEAGLVNAPIVSVEGQSENTPATQKPKKEHKTISNAIDWLNDYEKENFEFPFGDIKPGEGMFIAKEDNRTVDGLLASVRKQVHRMNEMFAEKETNDDGDNILDMVTIERKKRNDDGTIQLDNGVPRVGATAGHLPRMVRYRQFVVRSVNKGEKIDNEKLSNDGVIVVRVY